MENHRLHDNDTPVRVGERWDDSGFPGVGREHLPPGLVHKYIRRIHSFRSSSRNSCTCSTRWEPDRRNSAGCFPFPSFPSPSLSRSIWEYGRARASRQNPENSCCVFSREKQPRLVTNLSLRPAALSRQRYIGCSSSSPVRVRALITHEDYVANSSINIWRMSVKDIRAWHELVDEMLKMTFRANISKFCLISVVNGIWKISSSSIRHRYPSFDTINDAISK